MSARGSRDEERLRRAVEEIRGHGDAESFRAGAVAAVRRLVDGDIASYNEVPLHDGDRVVVTADPPETLMFGDVVEMFDLYARQNPLVAHYERTRDPSALRFSDLVSQRELRRLDVYAHVYRPLQIEHQMAMAFPADDRIIGLTMSRRGADFTIAERDLFERARPLLLAAYRDLVVREQLQAMLAHLERLYGDAGVVLLGRDGSPTALSPGRRGGSRASRPGTATTSRPACARGSPRRAAAPGSTCAAAPPTRRGCASPPWPGSSPCASFPARAGSPTRSSCARPRTRRAPRRCAVSVSRAARRRS